MPFMHYNILIHKYLTGVISSEENLELNKWLSADPLNKQEFEEIKRIWESAEDEETGQLTDENFNKDLQILERAIEESGKTGGLIEQNRIRNKYKNALIGTLSLITIWLLVWGFTDSKPGSKFYAGNTQNDELIFSDSSKVLLNDSSLVSFTLTSETREIDLMGEAFFDVKKDDRPFIVRARDVTITVLGTSFTVKSYPGRPVEVTVISGTVEVEYQESVLRLFQGEKSIVIQNDSIAKSYNDDPNFNAWYTGKLEFNKSELREILPLLEKLYHTSFNVIDPKILGCRFTGKFDNSSLEDLIETLSFSLDIEFTSGIGNCHDVSGKGCT